jgi:hypothetical protein
MGGALEMLMPAKTGQVSWPILTSFMITQIARSHDPVKVMGGLWICGHRA